jgi:hypothetical protein
MEDINEDLQKEVILLRERIMRVKQHNINGTKKFRKAHPEKFNEYQNKYYTKKYHEDPVYREKQLKNAKERYIKKKAKLLAEKLENLEI